MAGEDEKGADGPRRSMTMREKEEAAGEGRRIVLEASLATRRMVWVSDAARASYPRIWLALLEVLTIDNAMHKWKLLHSPEAFAVAKVPSM